MTENYVSVINLEKYQPGYKDRTLIWCKTYFTMINGDPEFEMLCEIDKWRLIAFIMLELQIKNPVPLNPDYLRRKGFDLKKRPISLTLQMLHTFVKCVTKPLHRVEKSRVDKSRIEESRIEEIRVEKKEVPVKIKGFKKPSIEEVKEYCIARKNYIDPESFIAFYESNGWKVGHARNPMKSWQSAIITWEKRDRHNNNSSRGGGVVL